MSERQEYCQAHIQYFTHKTKYGKSSTTKLNTKDWNLLRTLRKMYTKLTNQCIRNASIHCSFILVSSNIITYSYSKI